MPDASSSPDAPQQPTPHTATSEDAGGSGPADGVPALQKDASHRNVVRSSGRLRDLLVSNRPLGVRNMLWAALCVTSAIALLLMLTGRADTVAQDLLRRFGSSGVGAVAEAPPVIRTEEEQAEAGTFTFRDLTLHPDRVHRPYTAGPFLTADAASTAPQLIGQFRDLLALYEEVQGQDSNFDVRVVDNRTGELLELYTLEGEEARYDELGQPESFNWGAVDQERRLVTRRLIDKYVARGVPKPAITIKWGRANQVMQARERDLPFVEYEVRLARYLGMSLLPTEIGTVETFNQDRLVSGVGARSRYQLMPFLLRQHRVHHYALPTASTNAIPVTEEWHPLLVMEPAFIHMKASINAVGHEIPGISAYHTGANNIFKVYQRFLADGSEHVASSPSVMDAYMWAVTEGFDTVSENSSFGPYSRKYVASAYGALRATDAMPIDRRRAFRGERVQIRAGKTAQLSELLRALQADSTGALDWGTAANDTPSLYNRFRTLNPHFDLPEGPAEGGVPVRGDVRLSATASSGDVPVRFFLPLGATEMLAQSEADVLDASKTFRFDRSTYPDPARGEKTIWDRQYDDLNADIAHFGFTNANRRRLFALRDQFERLARQNPTPYRQMQQEIIDMHAHIWQWNGWEKLRRATTAALGEERAPVRPPAPLGPITTPTAPRSVDF